MSLVRQVQCHDACGQWLSCPCDLNPEPRLPHCSRGLAVGSLRQLLQGGRTLAAQEAGRGLPP